MRLISLLSLPLVVSSCQSYPAEEPVVRSPEKVAAEISIVAVERNIPAGRSIQFRSLQVIPVRYGATCGTFVIENGVIERFWVGGIDVDAVSKSVAGDAGTPILERWEESKKANDALFGSYCKGMVTINPSLYKKFGTGTARNDQ